MHWCLDVWKKFAVFQGLSRRKEYWHFLLCNVIAGMLLGLVVLFFAAQDSQPGDNQYGPNPKGVAG
jgi:uncharacterized membrane protein YhaH (DUF805 family)